MRLNESDRQAVARLVHDATAQPAFETIKSCLVWPDEVPAEISSEGYEFMCELWAVRGLLHRNVPFELWSLNPERHKSAWDAGLREIPKWPGFNRIALSEEDDRYLRKCLKEDAEDDD